MNATPLPGADELYEAAPCGHLLADRDGRLLHANATFCAWIGQDRAELLRGRRLQDLLTTGGRIFFHTHVEPLLRIQGSIAEVKLEVRRAAGEPLPMLFNIVQRPWNGGHLWHVAVFIAEDRHKYERELLLQRQRAEELAEQHARDQEALAAAGAQAEERAVTAEQMVGMVSHDIRNPLSVIHMSALLLERGVAPEHQRAIVGRISRAVQRVQHLIVDLLDLTQARLGRGLRVKRGMVDLHQVAADAALELGVAFPGRDIRHVQLGAGMCHADAERIAQAVGNLVANAVNHGAPGRPVTITTESTDTGLRLSLHNFGPPIAAELLPRLFEPMMRGAPGTASQGVGLGLFIVREIVRAHGGTVGVVSTAEEGTRFVIELPGEPG